jgi:hypothetical protein
VDFWTNRRSATKSFPRFVYFFMSCTRCQYCWCYNFYSDYRQSVANKNNPQIFVIGAANMPRFAYRHGNHLKKQGLAAAYTVYLLRQ